MLDYVVDSATQKGPPLGAELQVALNLIPAHTWYANPSGALTFLNERGSNYLGLSKDHPLRFGIDTGADWDSHIPFYIRTTTKRPEESGQPVCVQAAPARSVFGFVTVRERTAGFSVARNPCARAMELYCIGSALTSTSKNGKKQSSTSRRDNASRIWVAGHSTLLASTTGLPSCFGFMGLIRTARPQQ